MSAIVDLGVDLGTSQTKISIVAADGAAIDHHSLPTRWRTPGRGWSEQSPQAPVAAVDQLLAWVQQRIGTDTAVRSIGFTSMAEAGVLVDDRDRPQAPIIAWHDTRGAELAARLDPATAAAFPRMTGLPVGHVPSLFKLAWLRDNGIELRRRQWLSVPEYVVTCLGGERVSELSLAGRTGFLDVHTNRPWQPSLDFLGVEQDFLPTLVPAGAAAGRVRADHRLPSLRGAWLTVAGHDHAVAAATLGCGEVGSALDSFGTAEAFIAAGAGVPDPAVVGALAAAGVSTYPHVVDGATAFIAGTRTGLVLGRVLRMLGAGDEEAIAALDRATLALPPAAAAHARVSGFSMADTEIAVGLLSDAATPEHIWRAALEGGNAEAACLLGELRKADVHIERIVVAGGWTRLESIRRARQGLAPDVEISPVGLPGTVGAAAFGRWAASAAAAAGAIPRSCPKAPPSWWHTTPGPAREPRSPDAPGAPDRTPQQEAAIP